MRTGFPNPHNFNLKAFKFQKLSQTKQPELVLAQQLVLLVQLAFLQAFLLA